MHRFDHELLCERTVRVLLNEGKFLEDQRAKKVIIGTIDLVETKKLQDAVVLLQTYLKFIGERDIESIYHDSRSIYRRHDAKSDKFIVSDINIINRNLYLFLNKNS